MICMKVKVTSPIYDTEDLEKLSNTLSFMFPKTSFKEQTSSDQRKLKGVSEHELSLSIFKSEIKERDVRKLVEKLMEVGPDSYSFTLNKQDLIKEKISFTEEERALGNVKLTVETEKSKEEFLDFLFN